MPDYSKRLKKLQQKLSRPLLVSNLANVKYMSGFTGSYGRLLISPEDAFFITDGRYTSQAEKEIPDLYKIILQDQELNIVFKKNGLIKKNKGFSVEADEMTILEKMQIDKKMDGVPCYAVKSPVNDLRMIKDRFEIEHIKKALRITEEAMIYIAGVIKPGMTEKHAAAKLEYYCRLKGAEKSSFDTIVASGFRSAMPHGVASDKIIEKDEIVLFDFGIVLDGYCSDFTRVFYTGKKLPSRIKRMWETVKEAHDIGMSCIKSTVQSSIPDLEVRKFFTKKKVLKYYQHSLGHGLGIDIHEMPRLSYKQPIRLEEGMIVTVEPGLYYPGFAGIRLEDVVVVKKNYAENLTEFPLEIACLG